MSRLDWLPVPSAPPPALPRLQGALSEHAAVWLVSGSARQRLALAGALANTRKGVAFARLSGSRSASDAMLLIGEALQAPIPGSAVAVGAHLRQRGDLLFILDDADIPDVRETLEQLEAIAPDVRWLCLAPSRPEDVVSPAITLPAVPTPALGDDLHESASVLMLLPGGLPAIVDVPERLAHPTPPGRVALSRPVAEALRRAVRLEPSRAAEALLPTFAHVLSIAEGAPLLPNICAADLLAVRWMGEVLSDSADAARATAAAGRLLTIWGQPGVARALLSSGLRRDTRAAPGTRARLLWAEADAMLASGNLTGAYLRYTEADRLLGQDRDLPLLSVMSRRRGDALAARGRLRDAAQAYQQARAISRQLQDPDGSAAALRVTADLAVGQGELLSAEALYDQTELQHAPPIEAANRRLGRAALAIAQGALERADALLMFEPSIDLPALQANLARRRADLALRRHQYNDARQYAAEAITCYAQAGERAAMGRTIRLIGDIDAVSGRLASAAAHYMRATSIQIEAGDIDGLQRTLTHAIALEQSADDPTFGQELTTFLKGLQSLPLPS